MYLCNEEEKEDMTAITKPVESMDITVSQEEFKKIADIINNPVKPSDFVKDIFKNYQQKRNEK